MKVRFADLQPHAIRGLKGSGTRGRLYGVPVVNPVITDVRPCGGYQDPKAHEDVASRLLATRGPVRCMYPDEFVALLRTHRHPRWPTIGVTASAVTNRHREQETNFGPCGTVYVASVKEFRDLFVVPANCLPFTSIKTATWNEARTRFEGGVITRGWRTALAMLVQSTYLEPSRELSWLIGEDTFTLFPKEARG